MMHIKHHIQHRFRHLSSAVIWLAFSAGLVNATAPCVPWRDTHKQLVLGSHELGLPRAIFPLNLPHDNCGTAPSPDEEVCEYFDPQGIAYLVDQQGVIRVEARKSRVKSGAVLPLGLKFGDSQTVVRRKLAVLPAESPAEALSKNRDIGTIIQSRSWASPTCIEAANSTLGSFYVSFDRNGRLITIGMRLTT